MTSIQRTSPLDLLTSAKGPISSELLDKATAGATPEAKATILSDLRELVSVKSLGAATPKVTDELQAKLDSAPVSEKVRPLNQLAAVFFRATTLPPSTEAIYVPAFSVQSQIVGARTALAGQMAEATDEQKESKERLTDLVKNADSDMALSLLMSAWASFAQPVEAGKFTLPLDLVNGLPEALTALAQGLQKAKTIVLQSTMKALGEALQGGASEPAPGAGRASKASGSESSGAVQFPLIVAGKTEVELKPLVDAALSEAQVGRIVYDPSALRPPRYAAIIEKVLSHPLAAQLRPVVRRLLDNSEKSRRDFETIQGKEITKNTPPERTDAMLRAMYAATRETADTLGAGPDLTVVRISESQPNAYVYIANFDKPRVIVHDSTVRMCWDSEKNDWLGPQLALDSKGRNVSPDSEEAVLKGPAGKLLYQAVVGHELFHISDGVTENRYLLSILLGYGLLDNDNVKIGSAHQHSEACGCALASADNSPILNKVLASDEVRSFLPPGGITKDPSVVAERITRLLGPQFAVDAGALIDQIGLEAEVTADHGSAAVQGTNKLLATFFDMITDSSERGSTADRARQLDESLSRDLTKIHQEELEERVVDSYNGLSAIGSGSSHPPAAFRAIENAQFLETEQAQKIAQFKTLPSAVKLVAGAQAIEAAIEKVEDSVDSLKGTLALSTDVIAETATANVEKRKLLARLRPITKQMADFAFADGVGIEGKKPTGYIFTVLGFLRAGGIPLFQSDQSSPLDLLRNGGRPSAPRAPQCVNVFSQLAEELEARVADAGDKLSSEQRQIWGLVLDQLESAAGEGANALGSLRRQASSMKSMSGAERSFAKRLM